MDEQRTPYPYELATDEQCALGSFWWCIHHGVRVEPLTENIENRAAYIRDRKAEHEIETRLRAMRPVLGTLPPALIKADADRQKAYAGCSKAYAGRSEADADCSKAYADWKKADADRQKAYAGCSKADADCSKADADHAAEIEALFSVECADVAWGPDGLILPGAKS